jgi:hypothetical protein
MIEAKFTRKLLSNHTIWTRYSRKLIIDFQDIRSSSAVGAEAKYAINAWLHLVTVVVDVATVLLTASFSMVAPTTE